MEEIGTDDILPAGQEEAIFQHSGMTYQPGANGERKLARRRATARSKGGVRVAAYFLFFALVAVVLGIIGATAGGLGYLLVIGIVVLVADVSVGAVVLSRRARRRPLR